MLIGPQQGIGNQKKSWEQLVAGASDFHRHERLVPLLAACSKPHVMLWLQNYLLGAYGIGVQELRDRAAGMDATEQRFLGLVRADWVAFVDRVLDDGRRRS